MKVILTESQYVTIMEDIKKEQYRSLVLDLLETLFGKLSITDSEEEDEIIRHTIYDQDGADIADIYLGKYGNTGCKKDLTLSRDVTEILEGYIPYYRHKIFSKVFIDYIHDKLGIKCDCIQYESDFKNKRELDSDGTEYDWTKSKTRKYNVKKKKKIKESVDKNKKFLIDVMGIDFTDKIQQVTSSYDVPMSFDEGVSSNLINRWLNHWGPMYLVNINGKNYLYQDRGDFEMFIDEEGYDFGYDEVIEEIGIGVLGLKFSDIIDMFFIED